VNGKKLLGMYHSDVVTILKELPMNVRCYDHFKLLTDALQGVQGTDPVLFKYVASGLLFWSRLPSARSMIVRPT
jgi:hypothetical protein